MNNSKPSYYWLIPLFLIIPTIAFWRPGRFFFILDDLTTILFMAQAPFWKYLTQHDAEMWMPFSRLVYYGLIRSGGENYGMMILINCLVTGVNAFLLFLFLKRHLTLGLALALALFYAGAAVHSATAQMAYYINAILCLGFFLLSLLLTESFGRSPSIGKLLGISLCALLSILSWNYTILAIWTLPLYVLWVCQAPKRQFWAVTFAVGSVFLIFTLCYLSFAGLEATSAHNHDILSQLPGKLYWAHWFMGAFVSPICYLFWGNSLPMIASLLFGISIFVLMWVIIWRWGEDRERWMGLWALTVNGFPFLLVALARYRISIYQAYSHRYGVFTLVGMLLLAGIAAGILMRITTSKIWAKNLLLSGIFLFMIIGQVKPEPGVRKIYLDFGKKGRVCYQSLTLENHANKMTPEEANKHFCPDIPPSITRGQLLIIYRFLH